MPFHAVPHCIGIVIDGRGPDGDLRHILHAKSTGVTPTFGELVVAADTVADWVIHHYASDFSTRVACLSVVAKDESVVDGPQVVGAGFLPVAGSLSGNTVPSNVTLCISLRTALGGRSHRGRFYTWPPTTSELDANGNWAVSYGGAMTTTFGLLIAAMNTAAVPLAIKSGVLSTVTPITSAIIEDYAVDSQRRRLLGRGR